jgi:hypothetical protein
MLRTCHQCAAPYDVTENDLAFYDAVSPVFGGKKEPLPPPALCPDCRYRERLAWRNERNLHRRTCAATGKSVISVFSADKAWPPVYEQAYWWSDQWDAKDYGRPFDASRPFFEQWAELFRAVPQLAMNNQESENCEYTNQSQRNKDCYMIFCSNGSRDCYYGMWYQKGVDNLDCLYTERCELCYELVNCSSCHSCAFSQNLENCSATYFSRDCIGCRNCFGCVNLRNKQYMFYNEQLDAETYARRLAEQNMGMASSVRAHREMSRVFSGRFPHKYYTGASIERSTGDYIRNTKDTDTCFNCRDAEAMTHCQDVWRSHHCQDLTETVENSFCYSIEGCATGSNQLFSQKSCDLSDALYCSHCNFSKSLFGCVALRQSRYCILNTQYTQQEYAFLVPQIIAHMRKTGEWGRHFPAEHSPFGYNESVAQEYFPLVRDEALARGFLWRDTPEETPAVSKIIPASALPDDIADIPDDILQWAIRCEATGRPFRIIAQELRLYRQMGLPVPRLHPDERHKNRMALRTPRRLWDRTCDSCQAPLRSAYAPDRPETVYCESCYQDSVS